MGRRTGSAGDLEKAVSVMRNRLEVYTCCKCEQKKKKSARKDAGRNTKTTRSSFYPFSIWKKKCFDCCFSVFFSAESKLSHKETSKQTTQAGRFTGRRTQLMDLFIFPFIFQTILFSDRCRDVKRLFYIHNKNASADSVV